MIFFNNTRPCLAIQYIRFISIAKCSYKSRLIKNVTKDKSRKSKLTKKALDHFDKFYQPYYQDIWRSMRVALLSQQKYCAVVNNFANKEETIAELIQNGADDIIQQSRNNIRNIPEDTENSVREDEISVMTVENTAPPISELPDDNEIEYEVPPGHDARLYSFMPAQRVLSDQEELVQKEFQQNILSSYEHEVLVTGDEEKPLSQCLQVFAEPMGEVGRFLEPELDSSGKFGHHVMDAGAILPVLALGISPDDRVLDLCAGVGDKALTIIQTLLPGRVTCVDHSHAHLKKLEEAVKWYLPSSFVKDKKLEIIHSDAKTIASKSKHKGKYNKVLVDVPSFNDRVAVSTAEERLFSAGNQEARLNLQDSQAQLLISGIECCKPGGSVVYSTSTLSPPQNDGIIQQVLEHFQQEENIDIVIQTTKHLTYRFDSFMHFYDKCRYGQLVIPKVTANYGPTYFCKLKRLN